jgi:hypothetical protein
MHPGEEVQDGGVVILTAVRRVALKDAGNEQNEGPGDELASFGDEDTLWLSIIFPELSKKYPDTPPFLTKAGRQLIRKLVFRNNRGEVMLECSGRDISTWCEAGVGANKGHIL